MNRDKAFCDLSQKGKNRNVLLHQNQCGRKMIRKADVLSFSKNPWVLAPKSKKKP
jgi:hypothetical protein